MKRRRLHTNGVMMISIYNLLLLYISWNIWIWITTSFNFSYPYLVSTLVIIAAYSFILGQVVKKLSFLKIIGTIWFGIFQYLLIFLPLANLVVFALSFSSISSSNTVITVTGYTVIIALLLLFTYGVRQAYSPVIKKYELTVPKKRKQQTLRIAMASDMHFGKLSGRRHLTRLVTMVKQIKPDIVLLPGDIIDDDPKEFLNKKMDILMKEIKAPLGVYGVLGNHEYYGKAIEEFVKVMKNIDISILQDEVITINDSFHLVGRKDRTDKHRQSMEELTKDLDKSLPIITMDHQPYELEQAMECGIDVILSGHTHRGQMAPNHLITRKMYELDWGYKKKEQLHAIVSSGFGFWGPPIRIGSRSEVVQIDITFS